MEGTKARILTTRGVITELNRHSPEAFAAIQLWEGELSCSCREVTITKQEFIQMVKRQKRCEGVSVIC